MIFQPFIIHYQIDKR